MNEVDDQSLDVRPILILIGHYHKLHGNKKFTLNKTISTIPQGQYAYKLEQKDQQNKMSLLKVNFQYSDARRGKCLLYVDLFVPQRGQSLMMSCEFVYTWVCLLSVRQSS